MYGLLHGVRVVEGASFIAGPSAAQHLLQMGAEVIRFDSIGGGPDFRRWPVAATGDSLYWENLNRGKKSIALDLGSPAGRELAVSLATAPGADAGLFITNYPVSGFLSYERLAARRADVLCLRVMGWPDGAPGMDPTINASVGVPQITGPEGLAPPVNHALPAWDLITGAYGAFALTAALLDRRASGRGREIRLPLSDVAAGCLGLVGMVAEVLDTGADRPRIGNDLFGALGRDFATADGRRVMVVALTPKQWRGLVECLDIATQVAALEHEFGVSFATDESLRYRHRARLFALLEAAFAKRRSEGLFPALDAAGVTWGPYLGLHEAVTGDARLFTANPLFQSTTNPGGRTYPAAGALATLAGEERGKLRPVPRLGEHTDEVLAGVLGLSSAEIGRLHDAKTVAGSGAAA
jgi:2-methylfumaryl-CoA isomerase